MPGYGVTIFPNPVLSVAAENWSTLAGQMGSVPNLPCSITLLYGQPLADLRQLVRIRVLSPQFKAQDGRSWIVLILAWIHPNLRADLPVQIRLCLLKRPLNQLERFLSPSILG